MIITFNMEILNQMGMDFIHPLMLYNNEYKAEDIINNHQFCI